MKCSQARISGDPDQLHVLALGDLHIGHKGFDEATLDRALTFAQAHRENTRIVLMGDLLECATKGSVGKSVFDQAFDLNSQVSFIQRKLEPVADLIDGAVTGNHEERIAKDSGLDITEQICRSLKAPYLGYLGYVYFSWNKVSYQALLWHGRSGGVTEGAALNAVMGMRRLGFAHLYLMGHVHKLIDYPGEYPMPDVRNRKVSIEPQKFITTGSALKGEGSYQEMAGLGRPQLGFKVITLAGKKGEKEISVANL